MTTRRYALRDDQWQRIEHLLPGRVGTVGVTAMIIASSSRQCSIVIAPAFPGAICPNALATSGDSYSPHALEQARCLATGL